MNNILITGGAGFIGSNLALKLINLGYEVTVLDNLSKQIHGHNPENTSPLYQSILGKVKFIKGTVTSRNDWESALMNQNIIIHLAAETGTGQSMYQIEKYSLVNIQGTAILLDILANQTNTVEKVIIASSRAIYGEGKYYSPTQNLFVYPDVRKADDMNKGDFEPKCPISGNEVELVATDESSKIHPTSIYGISKQNQEQIVMTACKAIGIPSVALRYQNVYGPGQSLSNPYTGILSIFSTSIKNKNPITIFEDGKESRDFVYIDDVVDATILAIENPQANNEIFNVGAGETTNVLTVAKFLVDGYGLEVPINVNGSYRLGDIRHNYADITKIKHLLNFNPKVNFKTGIIKFIEWVNTQDIMEDKYKISLNELKSKGLYKV